MPADTSTSSRTSDAFTIRPAVREDVASIVRLIHGLAEFEKLTHLLDRSPEWRRIKADKVGAIYVRKAPASAS